MALLGLSDQEVRSFSVVRAVRALYYPEVRQFQEEAAFEFDVSAEASRIDDRQVGGLLIPDDVLQAKQIQQRALTAGSPTGGGHTIDDELQSMIDIFIENTFAADNVSVLSGLQGNISLPGQADRVNLLTGAYDFDFVRFNTTLVDGTKSWSFATVGGNPTLQFESIVDADVNAIQRLRVGDRITVEPSGGGTVIQTWTVAAVDTATNNVTLATGSVSTGITDGTDYDLSVLQITRGWTSETGAALEDEMSFRQVQFTPRHIRAHSRISKQLLVQSHGNIEMLIRNDLARAIAKAVDRALLYGTGGSNNQPVGISGTTGINQSTWSVVDTEAGRAVLKEKVLDAEEALANNNVPDQNGRQVERERMCKVLMSPRMKRRMKTVKFHGDYTDEPLLSDDNMLLGEYMTHYSTQVDHDDFFFCDWKDAVLAIWSGIEIMENPYSEDKEGIIRITTDQMCDVDVLRPTSMYWLNAA